MIENLLAHIAIIGKSVHAPGTKRRPTSTRVRHATALSRVLYLRLLGRAFAAVVANDSPISEADNAAIPIGST